jgi:class 3 adenylate cyclase
MFAALESGEVIEAPDAASDRRTAELYRTLLHDSHSRSVFVAPVRVEDRTIGSIMLEDASHVSDAHEFILLAADLIALRMRGAADSPTAMRSDAVQLPESAMGERSLTAELVLRGLEGPLAAEVFASAAVMAVRFSDARALASRDASSDTTLADRIAAMMQDVAAAHSIPYMKLLGHEVIAAAGLTADDASAIVRIADAAIAIREHCLEQFEVCGHPPQFRIGIDCGVAIGSHVGRQPRMFNLWGEAVRTASRMAEAGTGPGTIQVSESAYRRLREQFLLRLRGRFYVPQAGAEQTFVLGGRQ